MPGATIFKPGHLIGNEDRLYNTYAQLAKVRPPPLPGCSGAPFRVPAD